MYNNYRSTKYLRINKQWQNLPKEYLTTHVRNIKVDFKNVKIHVLAILNSAEMNSRLACHQVIFFFTYDMDKFTLKFMQEIKHARIAKKKKKKNS